MKKHPIEVAPLFFQNIRRVPGDSFAFTIRVRGQINLAGVAGGLFQAFYDLLLARDVFVAGLESVFYINAHLFAGKVLDMAYRRRNIIGVAEIFFNGPYFCW